jgi:hypothetical protein
MELGCATQCLLERWHCLLTGKCKKVPSAVLALALQHEGNGFGSQKYKADAAYSVSHKCARGCNITRL